MSVFAFEGDIKRTYESEAAFWEAWRRKVAWREQARREMIAWHADIARTLTMKQGAK